MSAYQEFINNGGKDSDWEEFAARKNAEFKEAKRKEFILNWQSGKELNGNCIANHLRAANVLVPSVINKVLQHDDTRVSLTSVTARGLKRTEARKIHEFVVSAMHGH